MMAFGVGVFIAVLSLLLLAFLKRLEQEKKDKEKEKRMVRKMYCQSVTSTDFKDLKEFRNYDDEELQRKAEEEARNITQSFRDSLISNQL